LHHTAKGVVSIAKRYADHRIDALKSHERLESPLGVVFELLEESQLGLLLPSLLSQGSLLSGGWQALCH
jgi:hypothetical protein